MSESSWVAIICGLMALINLIGMAYIALIHKSLLNKIETLCVDNTAAHQDLWRRIYGHQHEIECESSECGKAKATDIIIPHCIS